MISIKKLTSLFMTAALLCAVMVLGSCGTDAPETSDSSALSQTSGEVTYKVNVKDALGNPYSSGIVVKFMQNGEQVSMQPCDENGSASKTMTAGEYSVVLGFTDSEANYHYDENITLTAENNEVDVILSYKTDSEPSSTLSVQTDEYDAYAVSAGCTYVELDSEHRNYFLFAPETAGIYKFSVVGDSNVQIGYYGAPHFVQSLSAAEVTDNAFTISVSTSMIGTGDTGTSTFVLGIDALDENAKNCILAIERTGDALKTWEDIAWTVYETTVELSDYTLPEGAEIQEFDLTASTDTYDIVFNETDGFYHLDSADGPLVLVRLTEDSDYIASFQAILDRSGVARYFVGDDGEYLKKESYSECLLEYMDYVDESEGVYPLTEDLKYIIQNRGEYVGWWNPDSESYLFVDDNGYDLPDINLELAWLLMCCYVEG